MILHIWGSGVEASVGAADPERHSKDQLLSEGRHGPFLEPPCSWVSMVPIIIIIIIIIKINNNIESYSDMHTSLL